MRNLTLALLVTSALLCCGCSSLPNTAQMETWKAQTDKALAAAANMADKAEKGAAAAIAAVESAKVEMAAKGAPVDGSPAELTEWAKQNPLAAIGSPLAFLLTLGAAFARYRTVKKGLTAAVDAAEALPPDAAKLFKDSAASSAQMTPDVAAMIAAIKAR